MARADRFVYVDSMNGRDVFVVARNTVRVLLDSTRLDDILEVGEITGRASMERALAEVCDIEEGRRLLRERPELNRLHVDFDALAELPEGTVGRCLSDHLNRFGLDLDALNVPPPTPEDTDLRYLLRRYRGNHDIWHAILGLGTEGFEEVLVHAFTYGQLRFPLSTMVVFFGTLKHIILEGRWDVLKDDIRRYYELGQQSSPLLAVYWEERWDMPLMALREHVGLPVEL